MSCYVKSYFPEHLILSLLLLISLVTCQQHQQVNQQQLNQQQLNQQQQQQMNQQQANQQQLNQQQLNQQQQQQQQYQQQVNQQQVNQQQVNQQQYQQNNQQQVNQQQYQQNNQQQQQHGQQQQRFGDQKNVQDAEHINQHLEGQIGTDTSKMSPEQLQFHYFKIHDANDDNMLDGIELLHALTHVHGVDQGTPTPKFQEKELEDMIDTILKDDDYNDDGFIDYSEFLRSQDRNNPENQKRRQEQEQQQEQQQQGQQQQQQQQGQ